MKDQANGRGVLFAIGGRETQDESSLAVLGEFVAACGGSSARLLVLTTASQHPEEKVTQYQEAFAAFGVKNVEFFHQDRREEAESSEALTALDNADGVFMAGGGQLRLVSYLAGTSFEKHLHARHESGMPVGGSSAGASALSTVMIARGTGGGTARFSSVRMSPGLGFVPEAIIDQHFRERNRYGRLIAAVLSNPSLLGFGLDEGTGFALENSGRLTVMGTGVLTIIDAEELQASDIGSVSGKESASFSGIKVHALASGWRFYLQDRRVEPLARSD